MSCFQVDSGVCWGATLFTDQTIHVSVNRQEAKGDRLFVCDDATVNRFNLVNNKKEHCSFQTLNIN